MLQEYVNIYLEKLIAAVLEAEGDIIKFAGDAFIALWRNESQAKAANRCCRCCLSLIAQYDQHEIKLRQGSAVLRLHAGIATGTVSELVLGMPTSEGGHGLEVLYSGSVVERMGSVTNEAMAGELAVSSCASSMLAFESTESALPARVVRRLPSAIVVMPTAAAIAGFSCPSPIEGRLLSAIPLPFSANWREFIPAVLRAQLPASSAPSDGSSSALARTLILSEHRSLSIVALRVLGLGRGPCDVDDSRAAQLAVLKVQGAAAKFGGAVCRLTTDDKGTRFLIACGVPGFRAETEASAHSLYAWRALQIAQLSAQALEDIGLGSCCGLATGQAFCGECGSALRAEYTVFGSRVNLCFRLMSLAAQSGRTLLCDEATRQAILQTRPQQQFGGATHVTLKGFKNPVPCFEPTCTSLTSAETTATSSKASTRTLFGRDAELQSLERVLGRLAGEQGSGSGGLVVLSGETGVGKSALLDQFTALARSTPNVRVAYQSMDSAPLQATYPFGAFMGLLPQLLSQTTLASLAHHFLQLSDSYMEHSVTARHRPPSPVGSPSLLVCTDSEQDGGSSNPRPSSAGASSPASSVESSGRSSFRGSFNRRWRSSSSLAPRVIEVISGDSATSSPQTAWRWVMHQ
jgi:class 3 adenylate cyclase